MKSAKAIVLWIIGYHWTGDWDKNRASCHPQQTERNIDIYMQYALTHWGRYKMVASFPDHIFKSIFFNENVQILIKL